ncbi:MAG: hypothetical protein JWR72_2917, partial [Flavisolibacter sp.]|nr:hypothetical protein [Flavisolibacter sp.]
TEMDAQSMSSYRERKSKAIRASRSRFVLQAPGRGRHSDILYPYTLKQEVEPCIYVD